MIDSGFIDAHLHLQDPRISRSLAKVIQRARAGGVTVMLCNATREEEWSAVVGLADRFPSIVPYLGIHPWYACNVKKGWQQRLAKLIVAYDCGIGEIGLDKYGKGEKAQQLSVFIDQLELASLYSRPVAVHCVKSWGRLFDCLTASGLVLSQVPLMVHSFGGSVETMERLVDLGCYLSFSLGMLQPGRDKLLEVFSRTPLERILLETDAPDQGQPAVCETEIIGCNEPVCVAGLYHRAAQLKGIGLKELKEVINRNGKVFKNPSTAG